ncbi:unnamed protein product [Lota lota]
MSRDDSSGGWLAQDGGALSRVGVCRLLAPTPATGSLSPGPFLIHGERLLDHQVILECPLRRDLLYTAATPTFHHWKVEDRRCGLSFQSPADARAFDRGVRKAIEDLAEGSTTSSTTLHNGAELGDDDVFTNATDSSSNSSQRTEGCPPPLDTSPHPRRHGCRLGHRHGNDFYEPYRLTDQYLLEQSLSRLPRHVTFQEDEEIVRINPRERSWEGVPERSWRTGYEDYRHAAVRDHFLHSDPSSSYVHFSKTDGPKHEYSYPRPPVAEGGRRRARSVCEHCGENCSTRRPTGGGGCQDALGPGGGVRAAGQLHVAWPAQHAVPLHVGPRGGLLGPLLVARAGEGRAPPGPRWLALGGVGALVGRRACVSTPLLHACHPAPALAWGLLWGGRHKAAS